MLSSDIPRCKYDNLRSYTKTGPNYTFQQCDWNNQVDWNLYAHENNKAPGSGTSEDRLDWHAPLVIYLGNAMTGFPSRPLYICDLGPGQNFVDFTHLRRSTNKHMNTVWNSINQIWKDPDFPRSATAWIRTARPAVGLCVGQPCDLQLCLRFRFHYAKATVNDLLDWFCSSNILRPVTRVFTYTLVYSNTLT